MRAWERWLFAVAVVVIVFLGGIVVGKYQYWPYDALNRGKDAATALWLRQFPSERPRFASWRKEGGVTRWDKAAAYDGLTFMAGYFKDGTGAVLVAPDGRELHRWRLSFADAFPGDTPHILSRGAAEDVGWRGVHLYRNGDVLLNFEDRTTRPVAAWS